MNSQITLSLRGKVARRILIQFIACALLPIFGLAIVSYPLVRGELEKLGEGRLHEFGKYLSLSVYDRLKSLDADLHLLCSELKEDPGAAKRTAADLEKEFLKGRYKAVAVTKDSGDSMPILGDLQKTRAPTQGEWQHLKSGKALLTIVPGQDFEGRIFMMMLMDPEDPSQGLIVGEINALYLWGLGEEKTLPPLTELFVLDSAARVIFSTHPDPPSFMENIAFHQSRSSASGFEWEHEGERYLTGFRAVFTQYHWFYPKLTVVLSAPKSDVYALIDTFSKIFPSIILLSILVILFLTSTQIRKVTDPLKKLKEAASNLALGDLDTRVTIASRDEFQEVGEVFNHMAKQLGWQVQALKTLSEIDRAILSAIDMDRIIDTVVSRIKRFYEANMVTITLLESNDDNSVITFGQSGDLNASKTGQMIRFSREDLRQFIDNRGIVDIDPNEPLPRFILQLAGGKFQKLILLPLVIQGDLAGVIIIVWRHPVMLDDQKMLQARQLGDQVAVALTNARLVRALENLTWASLYALANAVDKKSPWTQDHSKRVTEMSKAIGRAMGLSSETLTDLERAALIHDIGKIGIADDVLTKESRLTSLEREEIERHPRKGAEILGPLAHVPAFSQIVAMVLQHHERFDGTGYPDGLAGNRITLGARILAVADVYDALVSDRPYRKAIPLERVLEIILEESGRHFDPLVVNALLNVLQNHNLIHGGRTTESRHSLA